MRRLSKKVREWSQEIWGQPWVSQKRSVCEKEKNRDHLKRPLSVQWSTSMFAFASRSAIRGNKGKYILLGRKSIHWILVAQCTRLCPNPFWCLLLDYYVKGLPRELYRNTIHIIGHPQSIVAFWVATATKANIAPNTIWQIWKSHFSRREQEYLSINLVFQDEN